MFPVNKNKPQSSPQNANVSVPSGNRIEFVDQEALSDWIDFQLLLVEKRHQEFETVSSRRGHFSR